MDPEEDKDQEMAFQNAKGEMKAVYGHSDSESSDNERRKALHVMFEGLLGHYVLSCHQDPVP
jgi:hypothetical protein